MSKKVGQGADSCPGLSAAVLKTIAMVTMVIDHIGAGIIIKYIDLPTMNVMFSGVHLSKLQILYIALRFIGRIAFPIFCFLLVYGFLYTSNVKRYVLRLGIFAIISEVPYDLCLQGRLIDFREQNVFITLLLGLLAMQFIHYVWEMSPKLDDVVKRWMIIAGMIAICVIAYFTRCDYGPFGVASIAILYAARHDKKKQMFWGGLSFIYEPAALFAFLPIWFYNGKRGKQLKYVGYAFYPVHLMILWGISNFILK